MTDALSFYDTYSKLVNVMSSLLRSTAICALFVLGACTGNDTVNEAKSDLPPQPPMWVVSDADSEITLYPTLHILPPEIEWKSDELTKRIEAAEEIWFEIKPGSESDPALQQSMMQLGMAPGSSLSANLTDEEVATLKEAIAPMGMPFQAVDSMRPWLVSTFVSVAALMDKGFDPAAGVEQQLIPMVQGKKIRALETAQGQLEMLASMPEETQYEMLRQTLGEMDESVEMLKELAQDWAEGDVDDLEDELLDEMKAETPEAYEAIFTARNKNWADQIEEELKGSGTDFIAVGAGHLVGEDGVPAMLRERGLKVTRL